MIFSPLQSDSTVNSDPQKFFIDFSIAYLNVSCCPTKLCLEFSSAKTVAYEIK